MSAPFAEECITHWFGSVEAFERSVRSNVAVALTQSLGNLVFPYKYPGFCEWLLLYLTLGGFLRSLVLPVVFMNNRIELIFTRNPSVCATT